MQVDLDKVTVWHSCIKMPSNFSGFVKAKPQKSHKDYQSMVCVFCGRELARLRK